MGEAKREHVKEIIAKAVMAGAVIERGKFHDVDNHRPVYSAEFFKGVNGRFRAFGETEYQCAVEYLKAIGISYEALIKESGRTGRREAARLRKRRHERSRVPRIT